jgi:prepilin-type N-terminal cleavage/methylation domain-containing protein
MLTSKLLRSVPLRSVSSRSRGFTLIELLVVIAVIALLISIALPALGNSRRVAKRVLCLSNLSQLGRANSAYTTDFQDRIATYTWVPGKFSTRFADIKAAMGSLAPETGTGNVSAAFMQMVDALRRGTGNDKIPVSPNDRMVQRHFTHVILNDYMSSRLPEQSMACPEHRVLRQWQAKPNSGSGVQLDPIPGTGDALEDLWQYSSSYQVVPAAWSPDQGPEAVWQYTEHPHLFYTPGRTTPWGGRRFYEVTFPGQKVWYYDFFDRHRKKALYHAYDDAVSSLLFFDTSVRAIETRQTNVGFDPSNPKSSSPTRYNYTPDGYFARGIEPPTRSGKASELVTGYFRWTRGGLKGVDYPGKEIKTGNP